MNISGFQLQRREARKYTIQNWLAVLALVFTFGVVGRWDAEAVNDQAKRAADRALTAVAQAEPVRERINALTYCKAPGAGQVLVMRADADAARGYACATYERYDWPQVAVRVDK